MKPVDLRSDTVTRPSPSMWAAMQSAELGDDVLGDDPTVQRLEALGAEMLGKDAALFTPSGTMANQIAIRLHTQPGDAILMEAGAHPFNYEGAAAAMISGVQIRPVPGTAGILDPSLVEARFRPPDPHFAPVRLVCAEDTANRGGGTPYPIDALHALGDLAARKSVGAHLDGARLFNAVVASGIPASERARTFHTVSVCLSKGLGAPVGSLLVGPRNLIERGRWVRKALGGGMRQSGILAAAGIHALTHNVERLADDHRRAADLARGLKALGYTVQPPQTNMVYVDVRDGPQAQASLEARGVRCLAVSATALRIVTHLDVDDDGIERAIRAFEDLTDAQATG
ncbi:MAG: GntG family PLP-dependent aldolase [Myxococcota bacterium]|nr:GntG family PLP-dependent aldolase [Myxococcota bacterium]